MADYKVTDTELFSIANAIRTKGGTQAELEFPSGFVSAVEAISAVSSSDNGKVVVNGELVTQTSKSVSENGTYDTTQNNSVTVNVSDAGGYPFGSFARSSFSDTYESETYSTSASEVTS